MQAKLEKIEAEKVELKKNSNRLIKHVNNLKLDMEKFHEEAKTVKIFNNKKIKKILVNVEVQRTL